MSICRFEVSVPNPGPGTAVIDLSLEQGAIEELVALGFPKAEALEIREARITLDPCGEEGEAHLELTLEPLESKRVFVVVETAGGQGAALLHLVDRRGDETGGVMLACFEGIESDPAGSIIKPESPCPIELVGPLYACTEDDPGQEDPDGVVVGGWSWLAVPLVNAGGDAQPGAFAYLEHLGGPTRSSNQAPGSSASSRQGIGSPPCGGYAWTRRPRPSGRASSSEATRQTPFDSAARWNCGSAVPGRPIHLAGRQRRNGHEVDAGNEDCRRTAPH